MSRLLFRPPSLWAIECALSCCVILFIFDGLRGSISIKFSPRDAMLVRYMLLSG